MLFGMSSGAEWIIAGLGNPGEQYARTRHNMGFLTVDLLAEQRQAKLNRVKFKSACNILTFADAKCLVMKPQTYMNLSGEAVGEAARFYHVEPSRVLVIFDDVSLPVGKIRVRPSGSAGGHNGIKSIIAHLGAQDFPRVKIGTGAPGAGEDMFRWVTGEPPMKDREALLDAFQRAIQAAECLIRYGCPRAMNDFNG